jgi:hypothetical protein
VKPGSISDIQPLKPNFMITLLVTTLLIANLFYTSYKEKAKQMPLSGENLSGGSSKSQIS